MPSIIVGVITKIKLVIVLELIVIKLEKIAVNQINILGFMIAIIKPWKNEL
ncbi:uncharacterized protein METZ01_LOCUS68796 [marine metagenome]|uniref:Uncharacterized protein n=1 Tax=marine metagenome TaxID=408172 RepID=A0A381TIJ6_9ZZZZ